MATYFLTFAALLSLVEAYVQVNYPLYLQLPPIAHISEPYRFQFAPTTFQADSSKIQYSLIGNPSWLSLDSNSRTLSGTPQDGDAGETSFTISAAGSAGAVASMPSKLLVATAGGPISKVNVTQVLSAAGELSGQSTMIIAPSKPFSISFPPDSFESNGKKLVYSALLMDRTPLPAWISFDSGSLRFSGTTPAINSQQSFEIVLIATSDAGYTASSTSFTISISNHQLVFQPYSQNLTLDKGTDVNIADIKSKLLLDGVPIQDGDLQSMNAKLPDWLKLDSKTFVISGKAPNDLMSQDFTVTAKDRYGDSAQFAMHVKFKSQLFGSEIGGLNVTVGEKFSFEVQHDLLSQEGETLTFDFGSLSNYVHFDSDAMLISGEIPQSFEAQDVHCTVTATSKDGASKDTQSFGVVLTKAPSIYGNTTQATGDINNSEAKRIATRNKAGIIIGAIVGATVVLLLLAALVLFLRQRRKNKSYISPKLPRSPRKSDISRPTFIPYGWPDIDVREEQDLEKGKGGSDSAMNRTLEYPPKLDLDLSDERKDSHSLTDSIGDADTRILDSFDESSWGIQNDIAPSQHPHDSMKIPTELAKRASQKSDTFRKHKRQTTTIYQEQIHRANGLPVNRRITGMGHGRHTYSPSRSTTAFSRMNLRRPLSTSSYTTTRCTSTLSTTPSARPQPAIARKHLTKVTVPREERRSIRIVPASIRASLSDRRTMDEKRSSYIRNRASAQSPFFSANGARESSSSYKSPPAFITETQSPTAAKPLKATNVIVRPDDDVLEGKGKELPKPSHTRKPSGNAANGSARVFPGSLRQNRTIRPVTGLNARPDRVKKSYTRPETVDSSRIGIRRRASTRDSLRAYDLKTSLNNLTGSEIFKDADLSDSVYTDEEDDIEEAERQTMKPGQYTLPPLNINTKRRSKRNSAEKQKRVSQRDNRRELKRTSERDPTPYYLASPSNEHGGKENQSSTYTLGTRSSPIRNEPKRKTIATTSPQRPKPTARPPRPMSDNRRAVNRTSTNRTQESTKERHSRKSIHSRNQSRASGNHKRHSRQQSTAYPFFDAASIDMNRSSIGNAITTAADAVCMPETKGALVTRDLSGNLTFYHNSDEEPTIEELGSSSIGFRTSNGQIHHNVARQSRLASLHESSQFLPMHSPPRKSSKRQTAIQRPAAPASRPSATGGAKAAGLGLFPVDTRAELYAAGESSERAPLGTLQGENKERVTADEDAGKGRQTWGSLKTIMGRGSKWISGGYWDKQGKDDKVFI